MAPAAWIGARLFRFIYLVSKAKEDDLNEQHLFQYFSKKDHYRYRLSFLTKNFQIF
jgi:hypothetical protein